MQKPFFTTIFLSLFFLLAACSGPVTNISGGASDSTVSESMDVTTGQMPAMEREVIQTGSITLRVDEITDSTPLVISLAEELGGRVDDQSQYTDPTVGKVTSANLLVRIPVDQYQEFIDRVSQLGNVEALNTSSTDVTLQTVDLTARINSLQTSIERLEALVQEASNVADLIAAESALAERQAELDSLLSQQKYLTDQVDLASIYIILLRKDALDAAQPIGFWAGIQKGFESVLNTLENSTTFIGLIIPWVLVVLLLLVLVKIIRLGIKRLNK